MKKVMRRFLRSFRYGEKGFTLVELLVVIAILGILAAVAVPNLIGMIGRGKAEARVAERSNVQSAMDAMMADKKITAVTPGSAVSDFATVPTEGPLYSDYMRINPTHGTYNWTATGLVSTDTYP